MLLARGLHGPLLPCARGMHACAWGVSAGSRGAVRMRMVGQHGTLAHLRATPPVQAPAEASAACCSLHSLRSHAHPACKTELEARASQHSCNIREMAPQAGVGLQGPLLLALLGAALTVAAADVEGGGASTATIAGEVRGGRGILLARG